MSQRLLIVDDSPFIRRIINDWLRNEPDIEVVGTAANGAEAVEKAAQLRPDVITMDVEMPVRDGLSALEEIMAKTPTKVLMVSSVTTKGADQTIRALELGAVDFVTKPNGGASFEFTNSKDELLSKVRSLVSAAAYRPSLAKQVRSGPAATDKVVLVASSTGGPQALITLFKSLPSGFSAPILVVQHMPAGFTTSFAKRLDNVGNVATREAVNGDRITPGTALIAPGGFHMMVSQNGTVTLSDEPAMHGVKPAADLLFISGAKQFGSRVLGIVLTGMGKDGAAGSVEIKKCGGTVIGEAESSCVVYGMPKAAKDAGGVDSEFPIEDMAQALVANLSGRVKRAS